MYLLDANVFIDAKNRYYGFDIVPAFWDWIKRAHDEGEVFTVQHVHNEIVSSGDDLSTWMRAMPPTFGLSPDANDQPSLAAVAKWVVAGASNYNQGAVSTFLASADYFLVAQAHRRGCTVVTHETAGSGSIKRVKIPDACNAVGVPWMTPFRMLQVERVRFRL